MANEINYDKLLRLSLEASSELQLKALAQKACSAFYQVLNCQWVGVIAQGPQGPILIDDHPHNEGLGLQVLEESMDFAGSVQEAFNHALLNFTYFNLYHFGWMVIGQRESMAPETREKLLPIVNMLAKNIATTSDTLLGKRQEFQRFLMSLATDFLNVSPEAMDAAIDRALGEAGTFMKVDRVYVFDYDFQGGVMNNTHEWCKPGIEPAIDILQNVPLEPFYESWVNAHLRDEHVLVEDVLALPKDSALFEILNEQGILSLITIPFTYQKACLGFIGFDAVSDYLKWGDDEITLLHILAEVITNAKIKKAHEEDLITARHQAEAASRAKSSFLANMSHEIRTPLNGVVGMLHLLERTPLTQEQEGYVALVKDSADALLSIINNVLDYSKIESGTFELSNDPFDLRDEVDHVMGMFHQKSLEKHLLLASSFTPGMPKRFVGDRIRIRQILMNLLNNAIKFTLAGYINLAIDFKDKHVHIKITDSGVGIPKDRLTDIFNQFTQVDDSSIKRFGGTGLGLAIVKQLIDLMSGQISVESELGKGTTFTVLLPLPVSDEIKVVQGSSTLQKNMVMLHVDDNAISRMAVRGLLEKMGYFVIEAASGKEALEILGHKHVDIILMDVQMPEMDGYETTRRIRAQGGRFATLPIVALSANAMVQDRELSMAAGMTDHIGKPFKVEDIAGLGRFIDSSSQIFDADYFLAQYSGDEALALEILDTFLMTAPDMIGDMEGALLLGNREAIKRKLHDLKGSSSYVGAIEMERLSKALMMSIVGLSHEQASESLEAIRASADQFAELALAWREKKRQTLL